VKEDAAQALESGHLSGIGGDVWFPQPAARDNPLRYAKNPWGGGNAWVPHMSGTSLDAQVDNTETQFLMSLIFLILRNRNDMRLVLNPFSSRTFLAGKTTSLRT
jgi:lactate dehydrogenase-like 2-hydroxyacid dehydrogenase